MSDLESSANKGLRKLLTSIVRHGFGFISEVRLTDGNAIQIDCIKKI